MIRTIPRTRNSKRKTQRYMELRKERKKKHNVQEKTDMNYIKKKKKKNELDN